MPGPPARPRRGGAPTPEELGRLPLGTRSLRAGCGCCAQEGAGRCRGWAWPTCVAESGTGRRAAALLSGWEAVTAGLGPGGGRPPCLPGCREAQRAATWGRIRAGPRWCCSSPLRCSLSRPGCSSTGGRRLCDRRGGRCRRRRRPGPGRSSQRCSLSGPCVSSGSGPGCEPSTARRAGTGYGGARAVARHRVGGELRGGEAGGVVRPRGLRRFRSIGSVSPLWALMKESSSPSTCRAM